MNTNMSMNRNWNSLATQTTASQKQVMTDFRLINGQLVEGALIIARSYPQQNDDKTKHVYEVRPRKDKRGVAAISDALPFIIALIVGGVLVFMLLYFGSFLVTGRQDARLRSQTT